MRGPLLVAVGWAALAGTDAPATPGMAPVRCSANAPCALTTLDARFPGPLPPNPWDTWDPAPPALVARHDAIIVLGCPTRGDGTASACQRDRVRRAIALWEAGYGDWFIVSGGAAHNEHVEADAMRAELLAVGVSGERIVVEPRSEHTDENIAWSTQIMIERGWDDALVVSSPGHLLYAAVCDANCCVGLGRLAPYAWPVEGGTVQAASYLLGPSANPVTAEECRALASRAMCTKLETRTTCEDDAAQASG